MEYNKGETNEFETDFEKCIVCQCKKKEKLTDPSNSVRCPEPGKGYSSFADDIKLFQKVGHLENSHLQKIVADHGESIESFLRASKVKWHRNCRRNYNTDTQTCHKGQS